MKNDDVLRTEEENRILDYLESEIGNPAWNPHFKQSVRMVRRWIAEGLHDRWEKAGRPRPRGLVSPEGQLFLRDALEMILKADPRSLEGYGRMVDDIQGSVDLAVSSGIDPEKMDHLEDIRSLLDELRHAISVRRRELTWS